MKKIIALIFTLIFVALAIIEVFAQDTRTSFIPPYRVPVTCNKTTNLIFPFAIKSVDRGSRDIIVQKAIGVENVLQVKSSGQQLTETNLTVVTADGSLYSYLLDYADSPANLNFVVSNTSLRPKPVAVFTKDATNDEIERDAAFIYPRNRITKGIKDDAYGIRMDIKGLYIHDEVIYFQFDLQNASTINYDVQLLHFYIQDRKKSKRTASQEVEVQPLFLMGNADKVLSNSTQTLVVAVPKFTIPDKKYFVMQLMEKNGGRNLMLKIANRSLVRASVIN